MTDYSLKDRYRTTDKYYTASQEDRSSPRLRVSVPATLRPTGGHGFTTTVNDLSLGGFSAQCVNRLAIGSLCWLKLPGLEALQCEVIWWQNNLVGCAFQNLLSPVIYDDIVSRYSQNHVRRAI